MTEPVIRRTQRQRRAATESRVLDAAVALIASHGSRAVTLAEVGRAAGYSRGIVNHHFGSREQLLAAVVSHAQHFSLPDVEGNGLDRLGVLVTAYLRNLQDRRPESRAFLLLWSEAVASDPSLSPLFVERDNEFRSVLAGYVRDGIDDGSIRPDADPEALAVMTLGLLRGIGMQLMSASAPPHPDTLIAQTAQLMHDALAHPKRDP